MFPDGFTSAERSVLRRLSTPERIQRFLDAEVRYNKEPGGPTCRSPRRVLRDRVAHCLEGALLGAAALRFHGFPPLLLDLEAVRDDDHVLAIYRQRGHWGAIAKSNYAGLRFREPVYRTARELVMSYFEHYYNPAGEKTLRGYSRPVNLSRFDDLDWMTSETDLWPIAQHLCDVVHTPLLNSVLERNLTRVDGRLMEAGLFGAVK
ncbi:MAG: transglutaminase-like domain-containing protein [Acidobacteria bacterium]|nr:transglutaminase-like domain-containing protein [Acidobacteriota bacterium]